MEKKKESKKEVKAEEPKRKKYSFYDRYWESDEYYGYDEDDSFYGEPTKEGEKKDTTGKSVTTYGGYKSSYGGYSYGGGYSGYSYGGYSYGSSYYGSSYGKSYTSYTSYYDRYRSTFSGSKLGACVGHGSDFTGPASVMSKAYKEARDLVIILDFPQTVHLAFSAGDGVDGTNGRFIFVETGVLNEHGYKPEEQINIICGLAVHEACHLKYSTYKVAHKFSDLLDRYYSGTSLTSGEKAEISAGDEVSTSNARFLKLMFNLIEDMRVEHELLEERPGYSSVLQTEKDYRFKQYQTLAPHKAVLNEKARDLFDVLVRLIRFPDEVEEAKVEKFSEIYEKLSAAMNPLPRSTKESCMTAIKMFKEVHKYVKDFIGLPETAVDSAMNGFANGLLDSSAFMDVMYGADSSENIEFIKSAMSSAGAMCRDLRNTTAAGMVMGTVETGKDEKTFFMKPEGRKEKYMDIKSRVSKYVPAMRKIVFGIDKNYEFEEKGCRSGLLDTTKLAEAYQGVPQVYVRKGEVKTNKVAIGVLIDESGSMGWGLDRLARDAAVLLNEALKDCPGVELFIYGHTADQNFDGSTEIRIYREGKAYCPAYALTDSIARHENRDGTAILEVARRIQSKTTNKLVMIVLSDGSPSAAFYRGHDAETDVRKKVQQVEKMGVQVIQATIGPVRNVEYMFSKHIDLQFDLGRLPIELSKVVKKVIIDNKVTTIS